MSHSVREFLAAAGRERAQLVEHLNTANRLVVEHYDKVTAVATERDRVLGELVAAILPELTVEACARAGQLTGHVGIVREDPVGRRESQRAALPREIAAIEADPVYRDRELLRAPRVGTLTRQLDELTFFGQPLRELVETCEAHLSFRRLIETGYGTDGYKIGFWRASYYSNWKAGDEVLEKFPGKKDFGEVRAEYLQAKETLAIYDPKLTALRREIADGEVLERTHDERVAALRDIEAIHLDRWRQVLARHLAAAPPESFGPRLEGQVDVEVLAKTWLGLRAKGEALEKLASDELTPAQKRLVDDIERIDKDTTKYQRPKNHGVTFDDATFDRRFGRAGRWDRRWDRYQTSYGTVYAFDDYNRGSFASDFLWIDLMSRSVGDRDYEERASEAAVAISSTDDGDTGSSVRVDAS